MRAWDKFPIDETISRRMDALTMSQFEQLDALSQARRILQQPFNHQAPNSKHGEPRQQQVIAPSGYLPI